MLSRSKTCVVCNNLILLTDQFCLQSSHCQTSDLQITDGKTDPKTNYLHYFFFSVKFAVCTVTLCAKNKVKAI